MEKIKNPKKPSKTEKKILSPEKNQTRATQTQHWTGYRVWVARVRILSRELFSWFLRDFSKF